MDATRRLATEVQQGKIAVGDIDDAAFARCLYDPELPDPDMLVRTSGEQRISNFLLWQVAYSEIFVTDMFWPDFREKELIDSIEAYQERERRFGQ